MSLFGTMSLFGSAGTLFYIVLSPFVNKSFSIIKGVTDLALSRKAD